MLSNERIHKLRRKRGLDNNELTIYLNQIESGNYKPSLDLMREAFEAQAWVYLIYLASWFIIKVPDAPRAYTYWAVAQCRLGYFERAQNTTSKALKRCSSHAELFYEMARISALDRNTEMAKSLLECSLQEQHKEKPGSVPPRPFRDFWQIFLYEIRAPIQ